MTTQTQCDTLLAHLRLAPITHKEAVQKYFIMGFLARICELRRMGTPSKTAMRHHPRGQDIKLYYLEGESSDARI